MYDPKSHKRSQRGTFVQLSNEKLVKHGYTVRLPVEIDEWLKTRSDRQELTRGILVKELKKIMDSENAAATNTMP